MLPISLVRYPDTPMYMEALSVSNIDNVRRSNRQQEHYAAVISLRFINWNIYYVAS